MPGKFCACTMVNKSYEFNMLEAERGSVYLSNRDFLIYNIGLSERCAFGLSGHGLLLYLGPFDSCAK